MYTTVPLGEATGGGAQAQRCQESAAIFGIPGVVEKYKRFSFDGLAVRVHQRRGMIVGLADQYLRQCDILVEIMVIFAESATFDVLGGYLLVGHVFRGLYSASAGVTLRREHTGICAIAARVGKQSQQRIATHGFFESGVPAVNNRQKNSGSKPDRRSTGRPAQWYFVVVLAGLLLMLSQAGVAADASQDGGSGDSSPVVGWFDSLYLQAGVGRHWKDDEDYNTTPVLVGLEGRHDDRHLVGLSLFENSFGQFSQYIYYGYKWRIPAISESVHVKLTGGLIHGYTGEYEDKLEFNHNGWAPAIIPSLGWKRDKLGFDFSILGTAGFMFLVGYDIWER